jgi:peptide/nickel transport system permease protein
MSRGNPLRAARALPWSGRIGLALVSFWIVIALIGPFLAPYTPGAFVSEEVFAGASSRFWFGSDFLGRDVLSRLLAGAQFTVGLSAIAVMDTLISIPSKIFALVLVAAFGSSIVLLTLIVSITYVPGNFRIARSLAVGLTKLDYVEVARARGEGRMHIALVEMLPNMIRPLFADIGLRFVFIVLLLSGLSFLGLGLQPPDADLGALVRENVSGLGEGALAILVPATAIASLTVGVNLLIDAATQGKVQ